MEFDLFSVDDHVIEHATVWTDRLPTKLHEAGPHVVEEDGREFWVYEGTRNVTMGLNAVAGKPQEEWDMEPTRFSDMIPGCYDPDERAKDMLADGIRASLCFPTLPRFGGVLFNEFKDKALADLCVRAYNDFMIDEWCASVPGLFVPMIIGQLWDPELCAAEIRRCAEKGNRAISFPENTVPDRAAVLLHRPLGPGVARRASRPTPSSACTSGPAGRCRCRRPTRRSSSASPWPA